MARAAMSGDSASSCRSDRRGLGAYGGFGSDLGATSKHGGNRLLPKHSSKGAASGRASCLWWPMDVDEGLSIRHPGTHKACSLDANA
jgi:hypothetical protein